MRNRFYAFMQGRYGTDEFSRFLLIVAIVVGFLGNFKYLGLLSFLGTGIIIYTLYRMFSKSIHVRMAENRKYLLYQNKAITRFQRLKRRFDDRKTHAYFKCKTCSQTVRVPKGKGKIEIICPKCGGKFIKKT